MTKEKLIFLNRKAFYTMLKNRTYMGFPYRSLNRDAVLLKILSIQVEAGIERGLND